MTPKCESTYGAAKTIRYLVNSIDDLRDVTDTVRFIVRQNSEPGDYETLTRIITISAIPMGNGASFILGFSVPEAILGAPESAKARGCKSSGSYKNLPPPTLCYSGVWTQFGFDIRNLDDLIRAVYSTVNLFQNEASNLDYINLKRTTRMRVKVPDNDSDTLKLQFSVPQILGKRNT